MAGEDKYYIFAKGTYKVGRKGTLECAPEIRFSII